VYETDELIDVDRLRELLLQGTGRGVRVAVLDTGVDAAHPALAGAVRSSWEVTARGGEFACRPAEPIDLVGHGTACAGIIHALAPEAELHSVKVLGNESGGSGDQLLRGLEWALRQDMQVINLSLGTVQTRIYSQLHELVDRAYFRGRLVVAAANNRLQPSYPSQFASVIAVDNESIPDPLSFYYRLGRPVELVANGIYVRAPSPGGRYQYFTGTSFACPHITGLVARLRSLIPRLTPFQVKTLLWSLRTNRDAVPGPDAPGPGPGPGTAPAAGTPAPASAG
jgi:subtilisin family serine protease